MIFKVVFKNAIKLKSESKYIEKISNFFLTSGDFLGNFFLKINIIFPFIFYS